jgi:DNA-binding GntR family transcriptional regulator
MATKPVTGTRRRSLIRPSLHAQLVEQLREMIMERELSPGAQINEERLCRTFDVSRTPLREALKVLAREGLVELRPNRSPCVSPITPKHVADVFELVSWLERHAGELAALRASDADIQRLQRLHAQMLRLHEQGKRTEYYRMNRLLHTGIVDCAGNEVLSATYATLMIQIQRARDLAIRSQDHWDRGVKEHTEILDALAARDGSRLGRLLMEHVRETGRQIARRFSDHPDLAPADPGAA